MSSIYEQLDTLTVKDRDIAFKINAVTREITPKNPAKCVLMQGDHNSERFSFEIPRFIEGRDVAACNVIQIYYLNIDARTREQSSGVYTVTDANVYAFVNDVLTCTWLISQNATKYAGTLSFMLRFLQLDGSDVKYAWNTEIYEGIQIRETLDSDALFENEYVDIIQQWKDTVMAELRVYTDISVENHVDVAQIAANKDNIATLTNAAAVMNSRMDTFTAMKSGSTTGDAELIDIRVGANGVKYNNAGEAVRYQIDGVNNTLAKELGYVYPTLIWERGAYTSNNNKDENRIRTVGMIPITGVISVKVASPSYYYGIRVYTSPTAGENDHVFDTEWITGDYLLSGYEGRYCRFTLKRADDSNIALSEHANLEVKELVNDSATLRKLINSLGDVNTLMRHEFGYIYPALEWEQGAYTMTSNANMTRIRTSNNKRLASGNICIDPMPGYRMAIRTYNSKGDDIESYIVDTGWKTAKYILPDSAGLYYRVSMSRNDGGDIVPADSVNGLVIEIMDTNGNIGKVVESFHLNSNTVKTIAHRGNNIDGPQCVEPAYIIARKHGHTIAENDVFESSDGKFVMWHDPTLSRLGDLVDINGYHMYVNSSGYAYWYDSANSKMYTFDNDYVESQATVSSLTRVSGANYSVTDFPLSVLKRIDFGVWKGATFKGTQILTFAEWVLLCKKLGMEIYIDRKTSYTREGVKELVDTVRRYGMLDHTSWIGVGTSIAQIIREYDSNARIGVLENPTATNVVTWSELNKVGRGVFFDGNAATLTEEAVQIGLNNGYEVECYYVDFGSTSKTDIFKRFETLVTWGVQGITTDKYRVDEAFESLMEKY